MSDGITPCLKFDGQAEEAMRLGTKSRDRDG
jgi:predicted 3-demethylubiquinone-9 3-methyltransferase (glyoxalase superfamily)